MDDTMDSCVTPLGGTKSHWNSRLAAISSPPVANSSIGQWRENLAGRLNTPVSGELATPGSAGSGVVTVGWRSVTERLQALRVQLQSAQKKLASTAQVRSAGLLITCFDNVDTFLKSLPVPQGMSIAVYDTCHRKFKHSTSEIAEHTSCNQPCYCDAF